MGCLDLPVSVCSQAIRPLLVRKNEEEIWPLGSRFGGRLHESAQAK